MTADAKLLADEIDHGYIQIFDDRGPMRTLHADEVGLIVKALRLYVVESIGGWQPISEKPKSSGWYQVWTDAMQDALHRNESPCAYFFSSAGGIWDWRRAGKIMYWRPIEGPRDISPSSSK